MNDEHSTETCRLDFSAANEWDPLCVNGIVYGHCGVEGCNGVCEDLGTCDCRCHQ